MRIPNQAGWPGAENQKISRRFIRVNGVNLELAECGPKGASGDSGKLAICLHGFPELNYSWRYQMPMLAKQGWRVWAPNMRGYGESDRPGGVRAYALDHLTQDVAALIDAAKAESPAREIMLVAHDWGAVVAWNFAIRKLRHIDRLVIMNVPHPMVGKREIAKWRQFWKSWYIFFFQLPRLPERILLRRDAKAVRGAFLNMAVDKSNFTPDVLDVYAKAAQRPGAITAMLNYYRALLRHRDVAGLGDGRIDTPTLLIWGEEDTALNIHCSEGTEEWVADLQVHHLPGVSHWVQQEAPGRVNAVMEEWLG
ncbi:MAG: alpha/beta fold hydrolase [Sphingorhabdus sp.]